MGSVPYFNLLPIELNHISAIINLEFVHKDAFDRLIIAQRMEEKILVITNDSAFAKYPVDVIL